MNEFPADGYTECVNKTLTLYVKTTNATMFSNMSETEKLISLVYIGNNLDVGMWACDIVGNVPRIPLNFEAVPTQ